MRIVNLKKWKIPALSLIIAVLFLFQSFGRIPFVSDNNLVSIVNAGAITSFNGSIIVTEDFTLTEDLFFPSGHGLIIGADDITIDGAGYKIMGNKTVTSCEWITETDPAEATSAHGILNNGYDNVLIKNLEIENFATGVWLHGTGGNKVFGNLIENCVIHDNGLDDMSGSSSESITHGIHMAYVRDSEIIGNEIYNNEGTGNSCTGGGNGIFIQGGGSDSDEDQVTIADNKLHHNAKAGFWTRMVMDHSEIMGNEIWENGNGAGVTDSQRGGIVLRCVKSNWFAIEENQVHNNYGDGIFIGGNNNCIINNIVNDNTQNGMNLGRSGGSQDTYICGNIICGNGDVDVYNCHENYGGGNVGDENTGDTAVNYRDEGTTGDVYFTYSCNPDTTPPETIITDGPSGTINYNDVTFTWSGNDDVTPTENLRYSYKLGGYGSSWSSWTSSTSKTYNNLPNNDYTFKVKARDESHNEDKTPAQQSFTVDVEEATDTNPPDTTIQSGPSGAINYYDVTFTWSGNDDVTSQKDLQYSYKLISFDSSWSSWKASTSRTYENLPEGSYTFKVKAKDEAKNVDSTPAERSFRIEAEGETNTYFVDWMLKQKNASLDMELFAYKRKPFMHNLLIPEDNIKHLKFKLDWNDDVTSPLFQFGKDTLTFKIVDPDGKELYVEKSRGGGTLNFTTSIINEAPRIEYVEAENVSNAKEKLKEHYNSRWKNSPIKIEVLVKIGEVRILRRLKDTGNIFSLEVSYEYYEGQLTLEDSTPPDTNILTGPIGEITTNSAIFTWNGTDDTTPSAYLYYSYMLKGKDTVWSAWETTVTKTYDNLPNGGYTFKVKAKDESGNEDQTPAEQSFTVNAEKPDDTPPTTNILNGPTGIIKDTAVTFTWTGTDDTSSTEYIQYSYKLEGKDADWSSWTTSTTKTYSDLTTGEYSFKVKAKDECGNIDLIPVERSFTINLNQEAGGLNENAQLPSFEFFVFILAALSVIFVSEVYKRKR